MEASNTIRILQKGGILQSDYYIERRAPDAFMGSGSLS